MNVLFDISESLLDIYDFYYDRRRIDWLLLLLGNFGDESMSVAVLNWRKFDSVDETYKKFWLFFCYNYRERFKFKREGESWRGGIFIFKVLFTRDG